MANPNETITAQIPVELIVDKLISRWNGWDEDGEQELPLGKLVEKAVQKKLETLVDDQLRAMIDESIAKLVTPIIDGLLKNGIPTTNSYGEVSGSVSIHGMIVKRLTESNRYNGGLPAIIDKKMAKHMDAEISKVTDRIAEIAKEASDKMFADKVRKAIGL